MTDLERFRDHCRTMAARHHIVNRGPSGQITSTSGPTESERALWRRMADEIDDYLAHDHDQPMLGDA